MTPYFSFIELHKLKSKRMRKYAHNSSYILLIMSVLLFSSCKKTDDSVAVKGDTRDSAYIFSQELYLWKDNLPTISVFKPTESATPNDVMKKVRTYSPTLNGKNVDRWSFAIEQKVWDDLVAGDNTDTGYDYQFLTETDTRVSMVHSKSPAGILGIQRSWKMLKINGVDAIYANASKISTEFRKPTQALTFKKPDGTEVSLTLNAAAYKQDYILGQKILDANGKKVGYFVFDSFLGEQNGQATVTQLNTIFADFKQKGVTELVIDLRYNGGGYISVAEHLANLIAPSSAVGKVLFSTVYNSSYSKYNSSTYFKSVTNNLNLSKVTFIITGNSASASELLINALRPLTTVKLIGTNSYGKPVGYFPIPTEGIYVFPVSSKSINSVGFAEYYEGFAPDKKVIDDLTKNFGDPEEACLKSAIDYYKTGILAYTGKGGRISAEIEEANLSAGKEKMRVSIGKRPK
jgi:carboxyl-terminal processing protease